MEQKAKKFNELNRYERAMATATLESNLEKMVRDLQQTALALGISISVDATYHDWGTEPHTSGTVSFIGEAVTRKDVREPGDLFGAIDEALAKKKETPTE